VAGSSTRASQCSANLHTVVDRTPTFGQATLGKSVTPNLRSRLYSWRIVVVALLAAQAALSLTLKQSPILIGYCEVTYLVLLLVASGVAAFNAVHNRQRIRLFWSFLAAAYGVWALVAGSWFYSVVLHGKIPTFLFDNPPLFLHIVFMIAAVVSRPHLKPPSHRPYRATLNFLILLFVWIFAYVFLLFPYQYGSHASAMILRFESLYLTENLWLLGILSMLIFRSQPPWKSIYRHLFGASALYAFGSLAANLVWALKDPLGDLTGTAFPAVRGLMGMIFTAAMGWFVWIGLQGRRLAPQLTQTVQPDTGSTRYSSALAMLAMLAIPIVGVWELFRTNEAIETHQIRLLLVMIAGVLLAVGGLIHDQLANREFSSDVGLANDWLRLAVEAGKSLGWDWDVKSGRHTWLGDLQNILGIRSSNQEGDINDFRRRVHPDDQELVWKSVDDAKQSRKPYASEFRIVMADGTVRWIAARGKFYYAPNGDAERMVGMAVDITERKQTEQEREQLSGRLINAQEQERSRLARELHDDFNQRLAVLAIDLERTAAMIQTSPSEASERMLELWNRASEIGADLHSLSHRLHSSTLESLGLILGVSSFCSEFAEQQGIQVDFAHEDVPRSIPPDVALCLFRIVQEGLRNVKKHSGASRAEVRLAANAEAIRLSLCDNGSGFNFATTSATVGLGIRSMQERLRMVGGVLEIRSRPTQGTQIAVWVPLKPAVATNSNHPASLSVEVHSLHPAQVTPLGKGGGL